MRLLLAGLVETPKSMGLFFLFGSLIPGYFVVGLIRHIRFINKLRYTGVQAAGVIISQREVQKIGARGASYETDTVPKVRYQTLDGLLVEGESRGSHGGVEFYDGQEAYVLYDVEKPMDFLFVQELNQSSNYVGLSISGLMLAGGIWATMKLFFT